MADDMVTLATGETISVRIVSPPLGRYADKVGCWSHVRDELLGGAMSDSLSIRYFIAEIDRKVVGSMGCYTPGDTRDVGLVEFVETDERHRRKGIASLLLGRLIADFRSDGGGALLLCTTNPIAGSLYEKHGFWYTVGDGMMYVAPEARDFGNSYLSHAGQARVREAVWGDLPRASMLYNHPEPDWLIKDYLTGSFRDTRFERHFIQLMSDSVGRRGTVLVLENPAKKMVGLAALQRIDTYYEQHVATLSFRVCPAYFSQTTDLLRRSLDIARQISVGIVQVHVADEDEDQKRLVRDAGFSETARLTGRIRDRDRTMDLLLFTNYIEGAEDPIRGRGDYYGGRQPWQDDRTLSVDQGDLGHHACSANT